MDASGNDHIVHNASVGKFFFVEILRVGNFCTKKLIRAITGLIIRLFSGLADNDNDANQENNQNQPNSIRGKRLNQNVN